MSKVKKLSKKSSVRNFDVKPLDPVRKCGAGTSVERLFKVTERVDGGTVAHLVYLDRHGWYCEHGRECPAVGPAKRMRWAGSAGTGARTRTTLRSQDFKSRASASFAIPARRPA